jgi:toxin ParE1/3/4
MMRVIWAETALANLEQIHTYIAEDKPEAAGRLAQRILTSAERLAKRPYLGRPGREPETRELLVAGTPYLLCYQVHRNRLAILSVLHAARERGEAGGL